MKNKFLLFLFSIPFLLFSCEDIIPEKQLNNVDADLVWNDERLATLYLNGLYNQVLPSFDGIANVALSDESFGAGANQQMYGLYNGTGAADSYGPYSRVTYGNIRDINILLNEVEFGGLSRDIKDRIKGQGYFLRAWQYWQLVKHYGGVPIILETLDPNDGEEVLHHARRSAEYCISVIVEDLDSAISLTPDSYGNADFGRITKSAAAALKGRVLLYFASPQFVPDGLTNPDGIALRWQEAYEANVEARDIAVANGHLLYPDFERIFLDEDNKEGIFVVKYDGGNKVHSYDNSVRPASVSSDNRTSQNPNWEFVKSFPMANGLPITDELSNYDSSLYWVDRDPRFYATVAYNGSYWGFPEREGTISRQWTYEDNNQEPVNTPTGFYVRKNVNVELTKPQTIQSGTDWMEIRFTEVLLNLAEAAVEIGRNDEARDILILIRQRGGILAGDGSYGLPDASSTKLVWRSTVMNERKIELAYENKRHWDMKRRNLYVNNLNSETGSGMNGTIRTALRTEVDIEEIKNIWPDINDAANPDDSAFYVFETYVRDTVDWELPENHKQFFNMVYSVPLETVPVDFLQPKYNFYFLPQSALDRNNLLRQTINWINGDFDPLAGE